MTAIIDLDRGKEMEAFKIPDHDRNQRITEYEEGDFEVEFQPAKLIWVSRSMYRNRKELRD